MTSLRTTLPSGRTPARRRTTTTLCWLLSLLALCASFLTPHGVHAATQLILPTSPGEDWRIIQGYACGTHNAWDRYSLDLAQVNGPTYGAAVRAAAAGDIWHWEAGSGTIILSHGDGFFTMYTHMQRAVSTATGRHYEAGETLGYAGDRGAPGTPHLHFTAFTASRDGWSNKRSVPLSFAEGYDLPEVGGCNQHGGTVMRAMSIQPPTITFASPLQPNQWYNDGAQRIDFTTAWSGGGLSQKWGGEPTADAPMFARAIDGYASLQDAGEGMRTLYVRVWGPDGKQTLATYGPIGFDVTAPSRPGSLGELTASAGTELVLNWPASQDAHAGVAGYRVYVGSDLNGKSDWFTSEPTVKTPLLQPGRYTVRLQSLDKAGNSGEWTSVGSIVVE